MSGIEGSGKKNEGRVVRGFTSKMARVQRMAAILIVGGMHTTATDVLDVHANLLPFQQLLRKACCHMTLGMSSLPTTHPLYAELRKALHQRKRHRTPMHDLLREFNIDSRTIEKVDAIRNRKWMRRWRWWHPRKKRSKPMKQQMRKLESTRMDEQ
jgi:hypothetical protein